MNGTGLKPESHAGVPLSAEHLAAMRKFGQALQEACFAFCDSDGSPEAALDRLFSRTPELLCAADASGRTPIGAAVAARSWTAANRLLNLAESARKPRSVWRRAPDTGEDALALAIGADQAIDEAVLRRLVRQRLLHCGCRCCRRDCSWLGVDRRGRNPMHAAAAAAAAGRPRVFIAVLEEVSATLDLLAAAAEKPSADEAEEAPQLLRLRETLSEALNSPDKEGWTPVHMLARCNGAADGLRDLQELSARHGLRPNWEARQAGGRGLSPLAAAAEAGAVEACEQLLTGGLARVHLTDDLWLRVSPAAPVRRLLGRHSRGLLELLADAPRDVRRSLATDLAQRIRAGLPEWEGRWEGNPLVGGLAGPLPEPSEPLEDWLAGLDRRCGAARLALWRLLHRLGQPLLAVRLEAVGTVDS